MHLGKSFWTETLQEFRLYNEYGISLLFSLFISEVDEESSSVTSVATIPIGEAANVKRLT